MLSLHNVITILKYYYFGLQVVQPDIVILKYRICQCYIVLLAFKGS